MKSRRYLLPLSSALAVGILVAGCGPSPEAERAEDAKPVVYVDSYPLAYFAERLAEEDATIVFPAPADVDPAHWKPDDETIRKYQDADLVLTSGPFYAAWVARASLPPKTVIDTTADFPKGSLVESEELIVHSHGDEGDHSHAGYALHTWLDPKLALAQAEAVRAALAAKLPEKVEAIDRRFATLRTDLAELETRLETVKQATTGMSLIASHPVYDYLAHAAEWDLRSLHWEPGEMPSEKEWAKFDGIREKTAAHWMLWEGEPIEPIRQALTERAVKWIVVRPCGARPAEGDFLSVMRADYDALDSMIAALADGN